MSDFINIVIKELVDGIFPYLVGGAVLLLCIGGIIGYGLA